MRQEKLTWSSQLTTNLKKAPKFIWIIVTWNLLIVWLKCTQSFPLKYQDLISRRRFSRATINLRETIKMRPKIMPKKKDWWRLTRSILKVRGSSLLSRLLRSLQSQGAQGSSSIFWGMRLALSMQNSKASRRCWRKTKRSISAMPMQM